MARRDEIGRLLIAGQESLEKGDFKKAAASFKKLLAMGEDAAARNNLSLSYYQMGQLKQALDILQPNLMENQQSPFCYPFAYSLGAMILLEMDRKPEAQSYLNQALEGYNEASAQSALRRETFDPEGEYLSMLMEAAGLLGEHAMVLDLFQRWARPSSMWRCHHFAATASFNLGDLLSASYHWGQIRNESVYFDELSRLSVLMAHDGYPLFDLEYREMSESETLERVGKSANDLHERTRLGQNGHYKIRLLLMVLDQARVDISNRQAAVSALVSWTGDWGREYGQMLMRRPDLEMEIKSAAASTLMEIGQLREDEKLVMNVDGEDVKVAYKTVQVEVSPEQEAIHDQGWQMVARGETAQAISLWEEQICKKGKLYPPVLVDLIQLYVREDRLKEAEAYYGILQGLKQAEPDAYELELLIAQAYVAIGRQDYSAAKDYFLKIMEIGRSEHLDLPGADFTIRFLDEIINGATIIEDYEYMKRNEVEDKDLPVNPSILRGLKNMPAIWLDEICIKLGIDRPRLRKDREIQIAGRLKDPDFLVSVLARMSPDEQSLLKLLLEKGGWSPLNVITRKYGALDEEAYFWPEKGTCTVPGGVWSRGLAMVGKAVIKDRRQKIMTIPADIREPLKAAFQNMGKGRIQREQLEQPQLQLWKEPQKAAASDFQAGASNVPALPDGAGSEAVEMRWLVMASGILYYCGAMRVEDLYARIQETEGKTLSKGQFRALLKAEAESPDPDYPLACENHIAYFCEVEDYEHILREHDRRRDLPYRPVTFQEAELVADVNEDRLWSKPVQQLFLWIKRNWRYPGLQSVIGQEARLEMLELIADMRNDCGFLELLTRVVESINVESEQDIKKTGDYLIEAMNNTPLWVLKGWTPEELSKQSLSRGAVSPGKPEVQVQRTARKADAGQEAAVATSAAGPDAKIGRNDLCPCKSGKKYKHCCGRYH